MNKGITKEKIEDYLYNWNYHSNEVEKMELEIEEVKKERDLQYEKYPQLNFDKIRCQKGYRGADPTIQAVIKIIDECDLKIKRLTDNMYEEHGEFLAIREAVRNLTGIEKKLIRLKYIERKRGERLYKELNYSKRGYYNAQKKTIEKILEKYYLILNQM